MNVSEFLMRELDLSSEQKEAIERLRSEHFEERRSIDREIRDDRRRILEMLLLPEPDMTQVREVAAGISDKQARLEILAFEHFREIKNICGDEQSERFDRLLREILHRRPPQVQPPPQGRLPHKPPPTRDRPPRKSR